MPADDGTSSVRSHRGASFAAPVVAAQLVLLTCLGQSRVHAERPEGDHRVFVKLRRLVAVAGALSYGLVALGGCGARTHTVTWMRRDHPRASPLAGAPRSRW